MDEIIQDLMLTMMKPTVMTTPNPTGPPFSMHFEPQNQSYISITAVLTNDPTGPFSITTPLFSCSLSIRAETLPQRSFYRCLSQAYEHDSKLLQKQNREMLALELSVLKERLTNAYRCLVAMADDDESVSPHDRIEAEKV